jgi:hypothetical protein
MTRANDICVRCKNLDATTSVVCTSGGERHLISFCVKGGKNAGQRKSCRKFEKANEETIEKRLKALRGDIQCTID